MRTVWATGSASSFRDTLSTLLIGSECIKRFEIGGLDEQGCRLDAHATGRLVDRHRRGLVEDARLQRTMAALLMLAPILRFHLENQG